MRRAIDLTGQQFSRLLVLKQYIKSSRRICLCKCDCGNIKEIDYYHLKGGFTQSCGCLNRELKTSHGLYKSRQYQIWADMKTRCQNPDHHQYKYYGGRGITVCERWQKFENFWEDMRNGYSDILTIDRIDNDGNYELANCKWSTRKEQNNNHRQGHIHLLTFQGQTKTIAGWAKFLNIGYSSLRSRIRYRWSIEKALTQPINT